MRKPNLTFLNKIQTSLDVLYLSVVCNGTSHSEQCKINDVS